jgi:hypothetical protein
MGQGGNFHGNAGFNNGRGGFAPGRSSNFVMGESSGSAGDERDNGNGQHFNADFGGEFGQFNRGSNFISNNRFSANPQYRPRNFASNGYNGQHRYGYNSGRSNYQHQRTNGGGNGGGNMDAGIQNVASLAGISPDLFKEAMQSVVAALTVAAQKGGAEAAPISAPSDVAPEAPQTGVPSVQQTQAMNTTSQQVPMQTDDGSLQKK